MMDGSRFDQFSRALTGSRRSVLGGTLALAAGRLGASRIEAKKKHKKRKPKVKPNEFGCPEVGDPCKNASQCCSGLCAGKKGKKRCGAHGAGTCGQNSPGVCTADNPGSLRCNNEVNCACLQTTAGSNFCADLDVAVLELCADCQTDADCEVLGFPAGSACAPLAEGECAGLCENGMGCVKPCGFVPTGA